MIPVGAGRAVQAHSHAESGLMLFVVDGTAILGGGNDEVVAPAGTIAHFRGEEALQVRCEDARGVTLLAVLAPPFPLESSSETHDPVVVSSPPRTAVDGHGSAGVRSHRGGRWPTYQLVGRSSVGHRRAQVACGVVPLGSSPGGAAVISPAVLKLS
jgi:hypothetical protein